MDQPLNSPPKPPDHSWWEGGGFLEDPGLRAELRKTFLGFCLLYLPHYFSLPPGTFHRELVDTLGNHDIKRLEIVGFRGSAKSTAASLALPLWAALEHPDRYPFIIPIADTGTQAAMNIANIKAELEYNQLLMRDYGRIRVSRASDRSPEPTLESEEEWQAKNMLLSNGVRILARSRGQKVRGLRHRQHRPSLVPIDDPEDLQWIKTKENRDKTEEWLRGEVMPAVDTKDGRIILIGNWLHEDAIMGRMQQLGTFTLLEFPLLDAQGNCTWPAMYPDQASLDAKKVDMGPVAWAREMLLEIVSEEGAVIRAEDLSYYDDLPRINRGRRGHGVDLAISTKSTSDFTACVNGDVFFDETGKVGIYLLPEPINARMDFHTTLETFRKMPNLGGSHIFYVEDVGYQKAAIQEMQRALLAVTPIRPTADKRSRLQVAATYIKNGTVRFPRTGCEDLIAQLLHFGSREHDDLVDALVYLILGLVEGGTELPVVRVLG